MGSCCEKKKKFDFLLWGSALTILAAYVLFLLSPNPLMTVASVDVFVTAVFELMNKMFFGLVLAVVFVGLLDRVPKDFVTRVLGKGGTLSGLFRATLAGVLLDLCSHGILVVGMKLYKRGASLGQVMAFIIASPWNSISLTIVLWSLVGFWWMMTFLLLSLLVAFVSGFIFDVLVSKGKLPKNQNTSEIRENFAFWKELELLCKKSDWSLKSVFSLLEDGLRASRVVLRWVFFGVVLAALVRAVIPPESFTAYFGPSLFGLGMTLLMATILEVCSEGSTPIAADILNRAGSPGNAFAFLMTGVSTDYTEIMSLKETTKSWKIALFLPLVTLPQIVSIALIINFA